MDASCQIRLPVDCVDYLDVVCKGKPRHIAIHRVLNDYERHVVDKHPVIPRVQRYDIRFSVRITAGIRDRLHALSGDAYMSDTLAYIIRWHMENLPCDRLPHIPRIMRYRSTKFITGNFYSTYTERTRELVFIKYLGNGRFDLKGKTLYARITEIHRPAGECALIPGYDAIFEMGDTYTCL